MTERSALPSDSRKYKNTIIFNQTSIFFLYNVAINIQEELFCGFSNGI